MTTRFNLTYDELYDADIHELLMGTPERRRSERIRQLIRLGMAAESGSELKPQVVQASFSKQSEPDNELISKSVGPHAERKRTKVAFQPTK